ncbi:MAG: hypothetical protein BEU04_04330 [Marine Group III euryarchaeote CG-Bathy1]|uniref:Digeranylgeranylglycerophospholipid reductase catalytic domain-containing protein n=1 Tax=Marine Group III euryarchaeote CG-Bathy1 TaxID=1889001 RepID=A0A1J5TZ79_9ARCH|nr:MAG: hypothetical protein BEU04_04330 [Marine Group III euryarchaeote CG-Bathy1]
MDKSWDLIIIGGGPAGSTAARYASSAGIKTLVLDRSKEIGHPLQCGELIPSNRQLEELCPNVPDISDLIQLSSSAISRTTDRLDLVTPSGKKLSYPFEGQILNRPVHDDEIAKLAIKEGAIFHKNSTVIDIIGNRVFLETGDFFEGKVIIGAGGPHDPLARKFWNTNLTTVPVSFFLLEGEFNNNVEIHFGSMAPGGYAWVIPKDGGANIGVGIQPKFSNKYSIKDKANAFVSQFPGKIVYRGGGVIPISGPVKTMVKENYLLVGDSAGTVFPSNGAGISLAMISGRLAGQSVSEHIKYGTSLLSYQYNWDKQVGDNMKYSKRSFTLGKSLFYAPDWSINLGFNNLTKPLLWRAITCQPMFGLF